VYRIWWLGYPKPPGFKGEGKSLEKGRKRAGKERKMGRKGKGAEKGRENVPIFLKWVVGNHMSNQFSNL